VKPHIIEHIIGRSPVKIKKNLIGGVIISINFVKYQNEVQVMMGASSNFPMVEK
jgi:hypothetical protein